MAVSFIFLINETATVIDPCINIRKNRHLLYIYIYMQHITERRLTCLVYIVKFTRNGKKLKQRMRAMLGRWNGRKIPTQLAA